MNTIFKKMQYRRGGHILVCNAPDSFLPDLEEMSDYEILTELEQGKTYNMVLCFVSQAADIAEWCLPLSKQLADDGLFWWAYTKKSSKKYATDITRDFGWQPLGDLGFEPVRMIAIDEDWSALRFRPVNLIKKLTRDKNMRLTKD
jgi:hypothetical protein